jgi:hypothetical protein
VFYADIAAANGRKNIKVVSKVVSKKSLKIAPTSA